MNNKNEKNQIIQTHTYWHTHAHTYTGTHMHTLKHSCTHWHTQAHTETLIHTLTHSGTLMHTHWHTRTQNCKGKSLQDTIKQSCEWHKRLKNLDTRKWLCALSYKAATEALNSSKWGKKKKKANWLQQQNWQHLTKIFDKEKQHTANKNQTNKKNFICIN